MDKFLQIIRPNLKLILGALVVIFVIAVIITIFARLGKSTTVSMNNKTFKVTVAKTIEEKQKGLSGQKSLGQDKGMLFVFNERGYYSFWMKDMKFPIDIIFIDGETIVTIYKNISNPPSGKNPSTVYQPKQAVDKVLEVNSGISAKYNIKEGNKVEFKNL